MDGAAKRSLSSIPYQVNNGDITHLETRESQFPEASTDALLKVDIQHVSLIGFLRTVKRCEAVYALKLISSKTVNPKCT